MSTHSLFKNQWSNLSWRCADPYHNICSNDTQNQWINPIWSQLMIAVKLPKASFPELAFSSGPSAHLPPLRAVSFPFLPRKELSNWGQISLEGTRRNTQTHHEHLTAEPPILYYTDRYAGGAPVLSQLVYLLLFNIHLFCHFLFGEGEFDASSRRLVWKPFFEL